MLSSSVFHTHFYENGYSRLLFFWIINCVFSSETFCDFQGDLYKAIKVNTRNTSTLGLVTHEKRFAMTDLQVKHKLCCFSNFTCKYSRNHSTAIVFILCVFDFMRRRLDYHDFLCRLTSWKGAGYVVLMGRVSVTISYSFSCLTTEIVKYINENSFIDNLAASKYSMWHREGNKCNNK